MELGTVKMWNDERGYGFITPDGGGKDVWVHARDFPAEERPVRGSRVEMVVTIDTKGPRADRAFLVAEGT